MRKPELRVVPESGDAAPIDMTEAIDGLCKQAQAAKPVALLIMWETADEIVYRSLPDSSALVRGMADVLFESVHSINED